MDRKRILSVLDAALDYVGRSCRADHEGLCQEHGLEPVATCWAARARELADELRAGSGDGEAGSSAMKRPARRTAVVGDHVVVLSRDGPAPFATVVRVTGVDGDARTYAGGGRLLAGQYYMADECDEWRPVWEPGK